MSAICALVDSTISLLRGMRNDKTFDQLYSDVISRCVDLGIDVCDAVLTVESPSVTDSGRLKRASLTQPKHCFKDSIVLSTLGHRRITLESSTQSVTSVGDNINMKN